MGEDRDILLLKSIAKEIVEHIWMTEFYNDAEDYILYEDAERRVPRSEDEIKQINAELTRLKNDVVDEVVEDFITSNLGSVEDIVESYEELREICHGKFSENRRAMWDVIKPELPPE